MTKVLFVCTGNICRSPIAEGVFRDMVRQAGLDSQILVDSAGTHDFHEGELPDARARSIARRRGYDISQLRARKVTQSDFAEYDLILVMDWDNLNQLQQQCPRHLHHKIQLLMRFASDHDAAVIPDPYYGGMDGFETVMSYVEDSCAGLLDEARRRDMSQSVAA